MPEATLTEELYNVVRLPNSRGEPVPDYMQQITLQEIYNYYFNWHPHEPMASLVEVAKWYAEARQWTWEKA